MAVPTYDQTGRRVYTVATARELEAVENALSPCTTRLVGRHQSEDSALSELTANASSAVQVAGLVGNQSRFWSVSVWSALEVIDHCFRLCRCERRAGERHDCECQCEGSKHRLQRFAE